ncbi:uncharacterized protein STEHIDRAFT_116313 [Stereum hirsutum FP-91666 SS1]|uniref:Uncharacterized protein n=1 Tax=Stereum hirsutum (strain FP-91666) TaxID=721885 RepID=R7RZV4_STEHR|nr:uncharacterized protein STEHIDRAFT_116313 [Stereum hirsutum FP-91666 SS1]EIM79847.1 hypothetical protein STEHIDRAFT_116313 [Stereum hirsutum FP-91666 SS1]
MQARAQSPHRKRAGLGSGLPYSGWTLGGENYRHPEISRWIKTTSITPHFKLLDFEESWWKWWCTVQPQGRPTRDGRPCFQENNQFEWEELDIWGSKGVLLVVLALAWWGKAPKEAEGDTAQKCLWQDAVRDVAWVLWELEAMLSLKRGLEIEEESEITRSRSAEKRKAQEGDLEKLHPKRIRQMHPVNGYMNLPSTPVSQQFRLT